MKKWAEKLSVADGRGPCGRIYLHVPHMWMNGDDFKLRGSRWPPVVMEAVFRPSSRHGGRVLAVRRRRRPAILDLAAGDVDHELGKLGGVAGTLEAVRHLQAAE
jgi:hypothetical protein